MLSLAEFKVVLSSLTETASKRRLNNYYTKQKRLDYQIYYLLPSNKWLQSARRRQPGLAFKTFDDLADLILNKGNVKYVPVTESERDLFFQQLLNSWENKETHQNPYKAKAYSQTYGQLKRLGLTLDDLPSGLQNLKPALLRYEEEWVKEKRLLDPENRFQEALNIVDIQLPLRQVVIDGYMDFNPLQYNMLKCLKDHGVSVTIYLPFIKDCEIVSQTIYDLKELGFSMEEAIVSEPRNPKISVSKGVTREEEIHGVLGEIASRVKDGSPVEGMGIVLADDGYKQDILRLAPNYNIQVQLVNKTPIIESTLYKTLALLLKQNSFANKWEKIALIDQLQQLLILPPKVYWSSKKSYMLQGELLEDIQKRLDLCIEYRRSFKRNAPLVDEIKGLLYFLDQLDLVNYWKERLLVEEDKDVGMKLRLEWMAYDAIIAIITKKRDILLEQGLESLTIDLNIFSQWLLELLRKKEIYVERKPAKGISLYSFRDVALFRGDCLFVMGMNEGVFPKVHKLAGYLQERDLQTFTDILGLPTKANHRKQEQGMFQQLKFLADQLNFSYVCGLDPENELQPSPFIEQHCDKGIKYLTAESRYKKTPYSNEQGFEQAAYMKGIGKRVEGLPHKLQEISQHLDFLAEGEELVNKELTSSMTSYEVGVTTLESYAACPFKFGLERLLKIRQPKVKEESLDPRRTGTMLHRIIERFYKELGVLGQKFALLSEEKKEQGENILLKIFEDEWKNVQEQHWDMLSYDLELEKVNWTNMLRKWWVAEKILFWNNKDLENMQLFRLEENVKIELDLDDQTKITLVGKIDRIDLDENGFVVYDYKSGEAKLDFPKEVVLGLKLQIPLYIMSIQRKINAGLYPEIKVSKDITAHGGAYISLKKPKTRASNSVWRTEHVVRNNPFKIYHSANKEESLDGEILLTKYNLKEKIKELWEKSSFHYSVKPLVCFPSCPYNGICRVTDELKEEGEVTEDGN